MRIYIAGPFLPTEVPKDITDPKLLIHAGYPLIYHNVEKAIKMGIEVLRKGHNPYIPHLTYFVQLHMDKDRGEQWYKIDDDWLRCCEGILMLEGWEKSKGATQELHDAKVMGLEVYYSIDDVPDESKKWVPE